MNYPDLTDPCWHDVAWRTQTLFDIMAHYQLTAEGVALLTNTRAGTVFCWRTTVSRPISIAHLKALMFELERGLV